LPRTFFSPIHLCSYYLSFHLPSLRLFSYRCTIPVQRREREKEIAVVTLLHNRHVRYVYRYVLITLFHADLVILFSFLVPCVVSVSQNTSSSCLDLHTEGETPVECPSTIDRAQMPHVRPSTGWPCKQRERERERARESEREKRGSTREANLTCPKIEALYGRARIQMDADRRPRRRRVLSPLPLALDEISLHPVLQQHEIGCSQLLAWFLSL